MKAVVLAAGKGVRLQPVTSTRPKHLVEVAGKPILEHCLRALKACGISETLIVVHHMENAIRDCFGKGEGLDLNIEYVTQKEILGTGNALTAAEARIKDDFILVYGDLLFASKALKEVIDLHDKERSIATMAVVPVENPGDYGIVNLEDEKYVKSIVEKPSCREAPTNLANAGIYILSTEIFEKIKRMPASARGEWEITDAISLWLNERKLVSAVRISREDWFDIGRPWDVLEANRWALGMTEHRVYGYVEKDAHLVGPVAISENARIRSGVYIEGPAFVGEESDIGPNCYIRPSTSIGRNVRIGNACEVKNSVIMDNTHIGHLSYVGDSIIGESCNLGAGTVTANYRLDARTVKMSVKGVVVDSGRRKLGVVLGDGVKTGINALLMPGVKIGCNSWIGPNVVVFRDLDSDRKLFLKQNLEERNLDS